MRTGPLERKEFQTTLDGQMLLFYPTPFIIQKAWKSESIGEDVGR
jgi:hypothetical protein